jgi:hypothetical protein
MCRIHLIVWIINILQRAYNYVHPGEFVEILCEYEKRYKWLTTIRFKRHDSPTCIWPLAPWERNFYKTTTGELVTQWFIKLFPKRKKNSYVRTFYFYFYLRTNSTSSTRARLLLPMQPIFFSEAKHDTTSFRTIRLWFSITRSVYIHDSKKNPVASISFFLFLVKRLIFFAS